LDFVSTPESKWWFHGLMLLTAVLVSTSFLVSKALAEALDPAMLTLFRFALASLLLLPWVLWKKTLSLPHLRQLGGYACISLTLTGFFWLMFLSLRSTSALNTGVIFTLVPGISGLYSAILLRERLGRYRLMALIPATLGAIWVLFEGNLNRMMALDLNSGDLIFCVACLLMAFYTPLVKLFYRNEAMSGMTFWILLTGCGWLLLLFGHRLAAISWQSISPQVWLGLAYLGSFCTLITFFLSQLCTLHLGPTRVMAYSYLYPPLILALEWASGSSLPSLAILPGLVCITGAMFIVQQGA
jgi:drug/metabolite transporter (DMT)-like permease